MSWRPTVGRRSESEIRAQRGSSRKGECLHRVYGTVVGELLHAIIKKSKIRQDFIADAGYGFGALAERSLASSERPRADSRSGRGSVSTLPRHLRKLGGIRPGLLWVRLRTSSGMMCRFPYSPSKIGVQS